MRQGLPFGNGHACEIPTGFSTDKLNNEKQLGIAGTNLKLENLGKLWKTDHAVLQVTEFELLPVTPGIEIRRGSDVALTCCGQAGRRSAIPFSLPPTADSLLKGFID